jgi:hypothetical protein
MSSPASPYIQGVLSSAIEQVWDEVKPLLLRALQYADSKYNDEDIFIALKNGEMQLWLVFDDKGDMCAFCITRIICYPREKRAAILFTSGHNVMEWVHFNEVIGAWATSNGCSTLEVYGRPGWEKLLAPYGYEKIHTVLKVKLPTIQ